jgi:HAD superfamily hydrolase (TIGR01509 family)
MKTIKMIFFDMDGCLIDSEIVYVYAWLELFQELNIPIELDEIMNWRGKNNRLINERINEFVGDMDETLNLRKIRDERFYVKLYNNEVELKPYAKDVLDYLDSKNIPYALVTSTIKEKASKVLTHFNLYHRFKFIFFGDDVVDSKPNPEIYLKAVSQSGLNKHEILVFEDSRNGIEACNNAGLDVVYVPDRDRIDTSDILLFNEIKDFNEGIKMISLYID